MLLAALYACSSGTEPTATDSGAPPDTADTGDSGRGGPQSAPIEASALVVAGPASSASGFAVAFGPDTDDDGTSAAWIAGYFQHTVCRFEGQTGSVGLMDGATCFHSESGDYPGYGLGVGAAWVGLGAVGGRSAGNYTGTVYGMDAFAAAGTHEVTEAAWVLEGEASGDYAGTTVAWLGGTTEALMVGAPGNDDNGPGSGRVYLYTAGVPGGTSLLVDAPTIVQGTAPAAAVRHGAPEAGDAVGTVADSAGDLDGDGLDELVIGCNGADDAASNAGLVAVFTAPVPAGVLALRDADALLVGEAVDALVGDTVAGLGDTDGDGLGELVTAGEMLENGRTWVFSGPIVSGTTAMAAASFVGVSLNDNAGASVARAGDTDGDGHADLLLGALQSSEGGSSAGAAYLVYGPFGGGSHSLTEAGAHWLGAADGDGLGRAVAGAGDYDGDGLMDVLLGAPYADIGGSFGGAAYVVGSR